MKETPIVAALLASIAILGITACSKQSTALPVNQPTCPVMKGEKVNPALHVDANGKRIYVCCPSCLAKVKADPETYINEMEAEGIQLEKVQ